MYEFEIEYSYIDNNNLINKKSKKGWNRTEAEDNLRYKKSRYIYIMKVEKI